jgi:hypothetical protein
MISHQSSRIREIIAYRKMDVRVFPEGGQLMAGEDNLVGMKLEDINGHGFADSGMIKDRSNKVIVRFVTNVPGCRFSTIPLQGRYDIFIKNANRYDSVGMMSMVNPLVHRFLLLSRPSITQNKSIA